MPRIPLPKSLRRQNDGKDFEAQVLQVARVYADKGFLSLEKVDPPTQVLRFGGQVKVIQKESPFVDFVGTWTERGGRSLFLEAKSTLEPVLEFGHKSGLKRHQIDNLERWQKSGAAVGLLWQYVPTGQVVFVNWSQIQGGDALRAINGHRGSSWRFEQFKPLAQGNGFVLFDFLSALRTVYP